MTRSAAVLPAFALLAAHGDHTAAAPDGAFLITDDGAGRIGRVVRRGR